MVDGQRTASFSIYRGRRPIGPQAAKGRPGVKQKFPLILSAKAAILITKTERQEGAAVDEEGLWRLFFATGLPQAYLAAAGERELRERLSRSWEEDRTAFRPGGAQPRKI